MATFTIQKQATEEAIHFYGIAYRNLSGDWSPERLRRLAWDFSLQLAGGGVCAMQIEAALIERFKL